MSVVMSLADVTLRVALLVGLSLAGLVAVGWRKPARSTRLRPRDVEGRETPVDDVTAIGQRFRRGILDLVALGGIAVGVAFVGAIAIALVVSWLVTNVIERL